MTANAKLRALLWLTVGALLPGCGLLHRNHNRLPPYWVTDLGPLPGGKTSQALAIADDGAIVGRADFAGSHGHQHAVLWRKGQAPVDLGTLDGGGSEADGISRSGRIVGWSSAANDTIHAALFSVDGKPVDLGTFSGTLSMAYRANDSGSTLVTSTLSQGAVHSYVVTAGQVADLGLLPGMRDAFASDLTNNGTIIGTCEGDGNSWRAFVWTPGSMQSLPIPDGCTETFANGSNSHEQVVGSCGYKVKQFHAVLWDHGVATKLNAPPQKESEALAVNDAGEIVGICNNHACVWKRGKLFDLNTMIGKHAETVLRKAVGVNAQGQIACNGVVNGQLHAYLLTPTASRT